MNALGENVLVVAKQYLGPAAQQFLSRELRALGCTADTITGAHLAVLADRARVSAARIMDEDRANEFGDAVAGLAADAAPVEHVAHAGKAPAQAKAAAHDGGAPKLAHDAAMHLFETGKLRQAEEAFRQLSQKHGDAESFRGLARTQVALEDVSAALLTLRDGAAALGRKGDRAASIGLLSDAVSIAPGDLAAHRRLAAAHANAGDTVAACEEYARFVDVALAEGDSRRAWLELTYARETLGDLPGLVRIVDRLMPGGAPPAQPRPAAPAATLPSPAPTAPQRVSPPPPQSSAVRRLVPAEPSAPQRIAPEDPPRTRPVGATSAMHLAGANTVTSPDPLDEAPIDLMARAGFRGKQAGAEPPKRPVRPPLDVEAALREIVVPGDSPEQQAGLAAMRATVLIAARDARATEAAMDASRRLLALHKLSAASDLLLDYIGAGYTDREAQRLLIEVDCGLGRRDVARDKCRLLGEAYRLDGRADTANDVERLAMII